MNNKFEDLINMAKFNDFLHRNEQEEKSKNMVLIVLAIVGIVAAVAGIAFAIYKYFTPDYLEDFEDDSFEDDFEDDYIEFSSSKPTAED